MRAAVRRAVASVSGLLATAWLGHAVAASRLEVESAVFDFGAVDQGQSVEHAFRLHNVGDAPLRVLDVKSTCGCTAGVVAGDEVPPGGDGWVTVRLDTARLAGPISKVVTIYTDDAATPVAGLTLTGQVLADLVVSPTHLYLGRIRRGEPVRQEIHVLSGRPGTAYAVAWAEETSPLLTATVEPLAEGEGQRVVVELPADLPLGRVNDRILLHTTSPSVPTLIVPVFGSVEGDVLVLPPQVSFGVTRPADAPVRELYIRNRGRRPVQVTSVALSEDVATYELATVREGIEYRLTLRLREDLPPGKIEGKVEIQTDHPGETRVSIPLFAIVRGGRG